MKSLFRMAAGILLLLTIVEPAGARFLSRSRFGSRGSTIALRRRLHISPLITAPGTFEVDWSFSISPDGTYSTPATLKYTPEGSNIFWGRTEFSVSADVVSSPVTDDNRVTHSSDHATFTATTLALDGENWNFAFAPLVTLELRGDTGVRAGGSGIVRYDKGLGSAGLTTTWTAASTPSATNPAGQWDVTGGYGRKIRVHGIGEHLSLYGNGLYEKATGVNKVFALQEGMEYEFTDSISWVITGQHARIDRSVYNHSIVTGITVNFGKLH